MNNTDFIPALTVHQPFADLIVKGEKGWETRKWPTNYRGTLVIHAALSKDDMQSYWSWRTFGLSNVQARKQCEMLDAIRSRTGMQFLRGVALGTVEVVDCIPFDKLPTPLSEQEIMFGYFREDHYFWKLEAPRLFPKPIDIPGRQRLWRFPAALLP